MNRILDRINEMGCGASKNDKTSENSLEIPEHLLAKMAMNGMKVNHFIVMKKYNIFIDLCVPK